MHKPKTLLFTQRVWHRESICAVYIPPSGNASKAAARVADCVHHQLQNKPDAPIFIMGDFNHCNLNTALPGFQQYVKSNTCKDKLLEKCYGNIENAYSAIIKPPLANSDHNTVHLIPVYKSAIKSSKPISKTSVTGRIRIRRC